MDYVYLQGSEDVSRAGHNMQSAAEQMSRAASTMSDALDQHRRWMDEWLERLQRIMEEKP